MDWQAFEVSIKLAFLTSLSLLPIGLAIAYFLAKSTFAGRGVIEAFITLPLVLPPTVLGYFLLVGMDNKSVLGGAFMSLTGETLAFSFVGLWFASIIYSLPFAVQPILRSLEQIAPEYAKQHGVVVCQNGELFLKLSYRLVGQALSPRWY